MPLALLALQPPVARATPLDSNFVETTWANSGGGATGLAWAPDGSSRLFVTIKEGSVRIVKNGTLLPTPFATETVHTNSECGVIGIAFDPNFGSNHYVYIFATVANNQQQIIRYTADSDVGTERTVIVRNLPTAGNNHDGGAVGFGPDGKLYWGIGDLGNGTGVDADLMSLAAKIGRANRDGSVPNDNPFFDGNGPNQDLIWAGGLRNPFTFTFQPSTGLLWVNSVGTNWEQVFVVGRGNHAGYNDYENNQPNGYIAPVIAYRTNMMLTSDLDGASGAVRNGNVVTFTTENSLGLRKGMKVTVSGVGDSSFNADYFVASVPSSTTFTAAQVGANATSSGGSVSTLDIGGSITGGTFLDTSAVPLGYRGNFFFAEYNTDRVERATLAGDNSIATLDHWATGITDVTDVELGPDGALYLLSIGGTIRRSSFNATGQALVVTPLNVRMDEAGRAVVNVRLATQPPGDVQVSAALGGDADVSASAGGSLTFTTQNWDEPQIVELAAARDSDATEDTATLSVSSNGLTTESVAVRVTDEGDLNLVVSQSALDLTEGEDGTFTVALNSAPVAPVVVATTRTDGDASIRVSQGAELTFTAANWSTPQTVTVTADQDEDNSNASARLRLAAAGIPERTVEVAVVDDDEAAPEFTSQPLTAAVAGAPYRYDANASGHPEPSYALVTQPEGMAIDAASGVVTWTPEEIGSFEVAIRAENGVAPSAVQTFAIEVAADQAPTCVITQPLAGAAISGERAEFYGDVMDDVGAKQAEFKVDDVVGYTDVNDDGHYHFGGTHNAFDTTVYEDGPHELTIAGYDTKGQMCSITVEVIVSNGGSAIDGGPPPRLDGGADADAGVVDPITVSVCGCRIVGGGGPGSLRNATLAALVVFACVARVRRRRRRRV